MVGIVFMTAGWAAILGFAGGISGSIFTTVVAVVNQRNTTKREFMLADRSRDEKLYTARRDAITDLALSCGDVYQSLIDNLAELIKAIGFTTVSSAQDKAQSLIDELGNEAGKMAQRFASMERIEPHPLPDEVDESLRQIIPKVHRYMVSLDLLLVDGDLKTSLATLRESWGKVARSWHAATAIAKKAQNPNMPELIAAVKSLRHWTSDLATFNDEANKYLRTGMGG